MKGYAQGDTCGRDGCLGIIDSHPPDNCSCHLFPPCSSCTSLRNFCPICGWEEKYTNFDEDGVEIEDEKSLQLPLRVIEPLMPSCGKIRMHIHN